MTQAHTFFIWLLSRLNKIFICCIDQKECIDRHYKITSSTITQDGTYYCIKSTDCCYILFYDQKAVKCKQLDFDKNIIKIEEMNDEVRGYVMSKHGFYVSKINEVHGFITKTVHILDLNLGEDEKLITCCLN